MSPLRRNAILALALVLGLTGGGALAYWSTTRPVAQGIPAPPEVVSPTPERSAAGPTPLPSASLLAPTGPPATSAPPAPSPVPQPSPTLAPGPSVTEPAPTPPPPSPPIQAAPAERPPRDSIKVAARYLGAYHAERSTWDDLLDDGRPIPDADSQCSRAWRSSGKDSRIDWAAADYRCLDRLPGSSFKPQGVAGSGTAEGYTIGGLAASERNIVLTSWYSRSLEKGLVAPNRPGESVTRLVVMDLDRGRYNTVELVRTDGSRRFRNLNSHGSGLAWAGQYIYSSSLTSLWMYNADDIVKIKGRYVLPAVANWSVDGDGGLSSISIDRTTTPSQLTAINYSKDDRAFIQDFDLEADGLLAANSDRRRRGLSLTNRFGQGGRVVRSTDSAVVDGSSFQGVATVGDYALANSSALRFDGRGPVDATVVLQDGKLIERYQMPHGNVESIYIDHRRGTYTTVTENLSQFLFTVPLEELVDP